MAVRWTTGFTNIDNAEAVGSWNGFRHSGGGSPSPGVDTDIFIQGNSALSIKVSGTGRDEGFWWDFGSGTEVDFTTAGHFWGWVAAVTNSLLNTIANGGLYVIAASDASGNNWSKWFVGGSDTITGDSPRFQRVVLDLNKTPSETAATAATISSIRQIGFGVKSTGTVKSENMVIDRCDYGDAALQVDNDAVGDVIVALQDFFDEDAIAANKYGIVDKRGDIFYFRAGLIIGDAAQSGTTTFDDDSGFVAEFENPTYHNGSAIVSSIDASALYKISAEGAGSQNTAVTFGKVVGTGDDRRGVSGGLIRSAGPKFEVDFETDIADLSAVNLFGLTLQGAGLTKLSGSTKTDAIGFTVKGCDEVQPNDAEFLNNTIDAPVPDRGLEVVSGNNIKNTDFIAGPTADEPFERVWQVDESVTPDTYVEMTAEANSAATGDWIFFPATEAVNDFCAIGSRRKFVDLTIDVGTAGVAGIIIWEYWSGSSWTALSNVNDSTIFLRTSGINSVTFDVPNDWASTSLNDEDPLYYVRARITTIYSTNPIGDEGAIANPVEHSTHVPVAGTFTYDNLKFFGTNTAHVENSSNATTEDSYPESNRDSAAALDDTRTGVGQSFTGAGGILSNVSFELSKIASPVGNATAKVYAHSGTFGTSSIPTGAALATSNTFDVSTLDGIFRIIDFEFEDEFTLVAATKYVVTIEYSGGDAINTVQVGLDASTPTHAGNASALIGSWAADSTRDVIFFVYTDAIVKINASNGADPTTDDNTGVPPGATIIVNTISLKVTVKNENNDLLQGIRVRYEETDGTLIGDGETNASGVFDFSFNFSGDTPANIIIRRKAFEDFDTSLTITTAGFDIPVRMLADLDVNLP